ncbi:MAG TPA: DUF5723 family protein [Bacteroidales bacterium]|nr:DUF5723 family protein [Bacteroidales bacterium]
MSSKAVRILVVMLLFTTFARSQNSNVMYYMNIPQNHLLNPALRPSSTFYLGLGITGIGIGLNNNYFNFSDVIMPGRSDSLITFLHPDYDVDKFLGKVKAGNFLTPQADVQLFGLGFNAGKDTYIFLDLIERVKGNITLPGDLIRVMLKGNEEFVGKTMDLGALDASLMYFREAGIGFSAPAGKRARFGIRAKALFGIAGISLDNKFLSITVNDDYTHIFNADLTANISGPVTVYFGADNKPDSLSVDEDKLKSKDFYLNTRNAGLGLDIGAVVNITDRLSVSAAVTDLGFLRWNDMITNIKAESQFTFSGFNITDVVNGTKTFDELADEMLDSLKNSVIVTDEKSSFSNWLAPSVSVGASYNITKSLGVGVLSRTFFEKSGLREIVTLSANLNVGSAFSTSISYTATGYSYDNFGAGMAFKAGFLQFYVLADRIPVIWNKIIKDDVKIPLPENWNVIGLRFGVNMAIGNNVKKKSDRPMLKVE